jgi:hypothetical protein
VERIKAPISFEPRVRRRIDLYEQTRAGPAFPSPVRFEPPACVRRVYALRFERITQYHVRYCDSVMLDKQFREMFEIAFGILLLTIE